MDAMTPSWDDIATLEHQINHELLDILGPNDTIKPSSGIAMMPTVLEIISRTLKKHLLK